MFAVIVKIVTQGHPVYFRIRFLFGRFRQLRLQIDYTLITLFFKCLTHCFLSRHISDKGPEIKKACLRLPQPLIFRQKLPSVPVIIQTIKKYMRHILESVQLHISRKHETRA